MPFFRHQQIDFHFNRTGDGPPVVLCHGLSGDLTQMQELVGGLSGHSFVVWDSRAHGLTEPVGPSDAFTFMQFAADLRALLLHLDIQRAIVGGVSMGAGVATRLALDWPEMVAALIVIRPAWLDQPRPHALDHIVRIGDLLSRFGSIEGRKRFESSSEYQQLNAVDPIAARQFCEQFEKPNSRERCIRLQRMPASCPIQNWSEVSALQIPALVIGCEPDYVHPFSFAVEWSQRLPQASLIKVPSKSIDPQNHNRETRRAIVEFLSAVSKFPINSNEQQ